MHPVQANPAPPGGPAPPPRELATREGYDQWAGSYDTSENPLVLLEEPLAAAALGDVRGLRIADIGCGTGRHAVRLAAEGAEVTAVDFSGEMLAQARAKVGADRVRFVQHDLHTRLPLEDGAFDRVICCLVLDHIADLDLLLGELRRICEPTRGSVLITVMHPAMMLKGVQARFTDQASGEKVHVESVRNQVSDYVMAAVGAGLRIEEMREYAVNEELVRRAPRAERYLGWPMLLILQLRPDAETVRDEPGTK